MMSARVLVALLLLASGCRAAATLPISQARPAETKQPACCLCWGHCRCHRLVLPNTKSMLMPGTATAHTTCSSMMTLD